ncbi:ATP-binding protein [Klebsiella pneumoniae]|uniref:ATP-binding protein n=1 Tax=Klebsiella pneumoniae TaxID=573 RepID=A0A377TPD4_KLEPN|nr:ATP-binding protein [Klebsiella pneumoniae]
MAMTGKCRPGGCRLWYSSKMGQIGIIESFDLHNSVGIRFVKELTLLSHCPLDSLLDEIEFTVAFVRPRRRKILELKATSHASSRTGYVRSF